MVIYPIKSCAGIQVQKAKLTRHGLEHDRSYAIVDLDSKEVMTQRKLPLMATVQPSMAWHGMTVRCGAKLVLVTNARAPFVARKLGSVELDLRGWLMGGLDSKKDSKGKDCDAVSKLLTNYLGGGKKRYGLIKLDLNKPVLKGYASSAGMAPGPRRLRHQLGMRGAKHGDVCALHDVAPYLIATRASLDDLNSELTQKVGMERRMSTAAT